MPSDEGLWAPDGIYLNGQYYIYYSVANSSNACALGLITSPTLNPSSPSYKWTDRGLVVSNPGSATYCTIDPAPALDADNNLWVVWGSGYSHATTAETIWATRLDNTTGLPSSSDTATPGHPLVQGHVEGSYLYFHDGYYYLWWNTGGCCDGASSTYTIHIARSPSITGPFTGSRVFYSSNGSVHGPGHMGIYSGCGDERFTYHYYPDTGGSLLGENALSWGSDGWPVPGAPSTTPLKSCPDMASGGATSSGVGGNSAGGGAGANSGGISSGGSPGEGGNASFPIDGGGAQGGLASGGGLNAAGGAPSGGESTGVGGATPEGNSVRPGSSNGNDDGCAVSLRGTTSADDFGASLVALAGALVIGWRRRRP